MLAPRINMDGRPLKKAAKGRGWGAHNGRMARMSGILKGNMPQRIVVRLDSGTVKSRLHRYKLVTREFPCFDEVSRKLFTQSIRLSGQVIYSGKLKSKPRFRVFMESESDDLPEAWCDWIDFDREDDAIDFMVNEHAHNNLLADENMLHDGRYFWSIRNGRNHKRYLGYFDGRWI